MGTKEFENSQDLLAHVRTFLYNYAKECAEQNNTLPNPAAY